MNHGGNIKKLRRDMNIEADLVDFSANINPLGMPDIFKDTIRENLPALEHYPDYEYTELKNALAGTYGISPAYISLGNGAEELIRNYIFRFKPRLLIIEPTFSEYRMAANLIGLEVFSYYLKEDTGFRLDFDKFLEDLDKLGEENLTVFLCNPNNPTGILYSYDEILALSKELEKRGHRLFLDESFIEFTRQASLIKVLDGQKNILLLRSLTKTYAIPGLRLGFLASSDRSLIEDMEKFRPDWAVNSLADKCGQQIGRLDTYKKESLAYIEEERQRLKRFLKDMDHIKLLGGSANFIMVHSQVKNFYKKMLAEGIVVRDCSNFAGLAEGYFRIAIRTREENDLLIQALERVLKNEG